MAKLRALIEDALARLVEEDRSQLMRDVVPAVADCRARLGLSPDLDQSRRAALVNALAGLVAFYCAESEKTNAGRLKPSEVLAMLREGLRPNRKTRVDVLLHRVLAEACAARDEGSCKAFCSHFGDWIVGRIEKIPDGDERQAREGFIAWLLVEHPKKFAGYVGVEGMKPWLNVTIKRLGQDFRRGAGRDRNHLDALAGDAERLDGSGLLSQPADAGHAPADPTPTGPRTVDELETARRMLPLIVRATAALGETQSVIIRLAVLDEVPQKEIARVFQIPESRVCRLKQKGFADLKKALDDEIEASPEPDRTEFLEFRDAWDDPGRAFAFASLSVSLAAVLRMEDLISKAVAGLDETRKVELAESFEAGGTSGEGSVETLEALRAVVEAAVSGSDEPARFAGFQAEVKEGGPLFRNLVGRVLKASC